MAVLAYMRSCAHVCKHGFLRVDDMPIVVAAAHGDCCPEVDDS